MKAADLGCPHPACYVPGDSAPSRSASAALSPWRSRVRDGAMPQRPDLEVIQGGRTGPPEPIARRRAHWRAQLLDDARSMLDYGDLADRDRLVGLTDLSLPALVRLVVTLADRQKRRTRELMDAPGPRGAA